MNNLFSELDNKEADELEDINSSAVMAELAKPIALNKQDQLYNKYNISLGEVNTAVTPEVAPVVGQN